MTSLATERDAKMAAGQPTSFRLSEAGVQMLQDLIDHMGVSRTGVIEVAIRELYERQMGVPRKKPEHPKEEAKGTLAAKPKAPKAKKAPKATKG